MIRAVAAIAFVAPLCASCGRNASPPDLAAAVGDVDHVVAHIGAFWTPNDARAPAPTECTLASIRLSPSPREDARVAQSRADELANRLLTGGLEAAHVMRVARFDPAQVAAAFDAPAEAIPRVPDGALYKGLVMKSTACDTRDQHPRATCTIAGRHSDVTWQLDWLAFLGAPLVDAQVRCDQLGGRWSVR